MCLQLAENLNYNKVDHWLYIQGRTFGGCGESDIPAFVKLVQKPLKLQSEKLKDIIILGRGLNLTVIFLVSKNKIDKFWDSTEYFTLYKHVYVIDIFMEKGSDKTLKCSYSMI